MGAIGEGDFVPPVAKRLSTNNLALPLDCGLRQGIEKDLSQVCAKHLRAATGAIVVLVKQHRAMPVQHP